MPALLVAHRRPGFYLRVITEGDVEAGEEIVKVASGPGGDDRRRDRRPALPPRTPTRAARTGAADPGAQPGMAGVVPGPAREPTAGGGNAGPGRRPRRRRRGPGSGRSASPAIDGESDTVFSLRLADPTAEPLPRPRCPASSSPSGCSRPTGHGRVLRSYSLSGPPGADEYRISVKREPHGVASSYLHDRSSVGDLLEVAAPRGTFILRAGGERRSAGQRRCRGHPGAGDAARARRRAADARVWWLHGARNGASTRSPRRRARCSPRCPTRRRTSATADPDPDDRAGGDFDTRRPPDRRPAGRAGAAARRRRLPVRAAGVHGRPHGGLAALGVAAGPDPHRDLRRAPPRHARASRRRRRGAAPARRTPGTGPRSRSRAAACPCPGTRTTRACSSWPRPATCRSLVLPDGRVPHLRDRPARPGAVATSPTRSTRPADGKC